MTQPQPCRARSHFWNQLFVFQKLKKAIYRPLTDRPGGGGWGVGAGNEPGAGLDF